MGVEPEGEGDQLKRNVDEQSGRGVVAMGARCIPKGLASGRCSLGVEASLTRGKGATKRKGTSKRRKSGTTMTGWRGANVATGLLLSTDWSEWLISCPSCPPRTPCSEGRVAYLAAGRPTLRSASTPAAMPATRACNACNGLTSLSACWMSDDGCQLGAGEVQQVAEPREGKRQKMRAATQPMELDYSLTLRIPCIP